MNSGSMNSDSSQQIVVQNLTKKFGHGASAVLAVDDLSFSVSPGRVTGFLGPNGAGKTTTLRCMLGLVSPTSGTTLISGKPYAQLANPARVVGAVLEAAGLHPARSATDHMRIRSAILFGTAKHKSISELLDFVGLADAKHRRAGGYSLGMQQRLNLAMALLGDPQILIMDEPTNGLDPAGIKWLRNFLRDLANQGRTVLVSSHLLSEVKQSVDDVVILRKGRMVQYGPLQALIDAQGQPPVVVAGPSLDQLLTTIQQRGGEVRPLTEKPSQSSPAPETRVEVVGLNRAEVGQLAHAGNIQLSELSVDTSKSDLEQVFLSLTDDAAPDPGQLAGGPGRPPPPSPRGVQEGS